MILARGLLFGCTTLAAAQAANAQPDVYVDLGTMGEARTTLVVPVRLSYPTEIKWFRVTLPAASAGAGFVDIWTQQDFRYNENMGLPGCVVFDASGRRMAHSHHVAYGDALLSCGLADPRPPIPEPSLEIEPTYISAPRAGQHGELPAGTFWLAIGDLLVSSGADWSVQSGSTPLSLGLNALFFIDVQPPDIPYCDGDFNWDGNVDQDDVLYLANVLAGGENPTGRWADYNRDGNEDQDDLLALVHTIAGGGCP
ncbi:MAG: hypothetical protein WAZ94_07115 [Phycisphaerales bacterium]